MRISDWSSDVCSSDLSAGARPCFGNAALRIPALLQRQRAFARTPRRPVLAEPLVGNGKTGMEHRLVRQQPDGATIVRGRHVIGAQLHEFLRHQELRERVRRLCAPQAIKSEEHTSELQSLMRISYAVFCLKKNKKQN